MSTVQVRFYPIPRSMQPRAIHDKQQRTTGHRLNAPTYTKHGICSPELLKHVHDVIEATQTEDLSHVYLILSNACRIQSPSTNQ
jgi:hypothetical protein